MGLIKSCFFVSFYGEYNVVIEVAEREYSITKYKWIIDIYDYGKIVELT